MPYHQCYPHKLQPSGQTKGSTRPQFYPSPSSAPSRAPDIVNILFLTRMDTPLSSETWPIGGFFLLHLIKKAPYHLHTRILYICIQYYFWEEEPLIFSPWEDLNFPAPDNNLLLFPCTSLDVVLDKLVFLQYSEHVFAINFDYWIIWYWPCTQTASHSSNSSLTVDIWKDKQMDTRTMIPMA